MKGVFLKDFLTLKRAGLTYLFCVLIFAAFGVFTENFSVSIAAGFFLGISVTSLIVDSDEKDGWDKFARGIGLTAFQNVFPLYVLSFTIAVLAFLLGFVPPLFSGSFSLDASMPVFVSLFLMLAVFSLVIPLMIKFGAEKGRLVFAGVFLISIVLVIASFSYVQNVSSPLLMFSPLLGVAAMIFSCVVSVKIYRKKEF